MTLLYHLCYCDR